jgi:hypothetical protein
MVHSSFKAPIAAIGAAMLISSCDLNRQSQVEADARKVIFDPKSSHAAIAESVFAVFCAKNKCRDRLAYDLKTDLAFDLIVEFRNRRGIDMQQGKFDYFACFVSRSAVYCAGFEQPILLREIPRKG